MMQIYTSKTKARKKMLCELGTPLLLASCRLTFLKAFHAPAPIKNLFLTGKKRVAGTANFYIYFGHC
jgi:hypothetical protein